MASYDVEVLIHVNVKVRVNGVSEGQDAMDVVAMYGEDQVMEILAKAVHDDVALVDVTDYREVTG